MAKLTVDRLVKSYGALTIIKGVSFTLEGGELLSLVGPSGCGKTTTLRCIAGFERPDSGRILFDDKPLVDAEQGVFVPPNRRHFGMVFQSYAVWPHMTVFENVAYPLRVRGTYSQAEISDRVSDQLRIVGLGGYDKRHPGQLSGGQQQRVALARALVMEPRALLFDEPLSNLDAKLRERMRFELIEIQSRLGIPAIYVTHDQAEAMVMSKRIIVMDGGQIAQSGTPQEIYHTPRNRFVADFVGVSNFLEGEIVEAQADGQWRVSTQVGDLSCVGEPPDTARGSKVLVVIRPESISLDKMARAGSNTIKAVLQQKFDMGSHTEFFLEAEGIVLRGQSFEWAGIGVGEDACLSIAPQDCRIIDP